MTPRRLVWPLDVLPGLLGGLFISSMFFWASSFPSKGNFLSQVRVTEIHLFYNLQLFYWHFIETLWIFIFLDVLPGLLGAAPSPQDLVVVTGSSN